MINLEPQLHRRSLLKAILSWPLAWMGGFGLTKAAPFYTMHGGCRSHKTEIPRPWSYSDMMSLDSSPIINNCGPPGSGMPIITKNLRVYEVRIYDPGGVINE